jgi:hypothetical protein
LTFDITDPATYVPIIAGVIIPFLVALIAKANTSGTVKSGLAALGAALTALGLYLTDTTGVRTWAGAASAFVLALVIAAASRVSLTGDKVDAVAAKIPGGLV